MAEPAWLTRARSLIGTRETPGPASNPTIMAMAKRLGATVLGIAYADDSVPWCGLFVAECIASAKVNTASIAVRAASWASWGYELKAGAPGAVLVFKRPGGGHVGFYVGEDHTHFHVLGGNQSDAVTVARIEKARCVAIRWPGIDAPKPGKPIFVTAGRVAVSASEA